LLNRSRRRFLLAGSAAATLTVSGIAPARAAGIDQLRTFLTQTKTARGEFSQRVGSRNSPKTQISSGAFVFQRPGRFRWTYVKPYEQVIVADGETLYLFDKDLNQVTVKKLAGAIPASPASILFGSNQFEKDFEVRDSGTRDDLEWIVATPRARDTPFEKIEIGFRDGLPAAMQLADSFGQTSQLRFSKVERDPVVDPQTFRFTPPPGADVLDSR
jgi:outer membrane lipoprotein carrier protein